MRHEIVLAPQAVQDLPRLRANERSAIRDAIEIHLRYQPTKTSRSLIKRLREVSHPEYRLRVGEIRIFYDVTEDQVVITRHGKPVGVLIGFSSEEDWFEYRLQNDPRFLCRIEAARQRLRKGQGVLLEDVEE